MNAEDVYADDFVDDEGAKQHDNNNLEIVKSDSSSHLFENAPSIVTQNETTPLPGGDNASLLDQIQALNQSLEKERSVSENLRLQLATRQHEKGDDNSSYDDVFLSDRLVKEGEKNIQLALEVSRVKDELSQLQKQTEKFRQALLNGINDGMGETQRFSNVSLVDLLRIRLQAHSQRDSDVSSTSDPSAKPASTHYSLQSKETSNKSSDEVLALKERYSELQRKCSELVQKLDCYKESEQKNNELKQKLSRLMDRTRNEKEKREKVNDEVTLANRKIEALSEHIEKLMVHLKYEATSKSKAVSELGRVCRELELCKNQNNILEKKNSSKDKVITELKEAGKILQDQLRLMDDKYMELRLKLDWSRTQTERLLKSKDDELRELRTKLTLSSQQTGGGAGKQKAPISSQDQCEVDHPTESTKLIIPTTKNLSSPSAILKKHSSNKSALARSVHFREQVLEKG